MDRYDVWSDRTVGCVRAGECSLRRVAGQPIRFSTTTAGPRLPGGRNGVAGEAAAGGRERVELV
jgi:hypothetical protein